MVFQEAGKIRRIWALAGEGAEPPARRQAARPASGYPAGSMWSWIVVGVLYASGILFFQLLGGLGAAATAIQRWGRSSSERRRAGIEAMLRNRAARR